MRPERLLLDDIQACCRDISRFVDGIAHDEFLTNELLRHAVLSKLIIIGEAASKLSPVLKRRHPTTPWQKVISFRNFAVHVYFAIKWEYVWVTATVNVPELLTAISQVINVEFPPNG